MLPWKKLHNLKIKPLKLVKTLRSQSKEQFKELEKNLNKLNNKLNKTLKILRLLQKEEQEKPKSIMLLKRNAKNKLALNKETIVKDKFV